jgi:hypothetical protein
LLPQLPIQSDSSSEEKTVITEPSEKSYGNVEELKTWGQLFTVLGSSGF